MEVLGFLWKFLQAERFYNNQYWIFSLKLFVDMGRRRVARVSGNEMYQTVKLVENMTAY